MMPTSSRLLLLTLGLVLPLYSGCGSSEEPTPAPSAIASDQNPETEESTGTSHGDATAQPASRQKISFRKGAGEDLYELKFKDDGGAKLVDSDEAEIARFTVSGGKLKVKLPDDSVVAYVVARENGFEIRDESQKTELFDMKRYPDGDWKLKLADESVLAVVKKRDYGYEIEDGNEASLFKVKLKSGKTSLRTAQDETVLYTKNSIPTLCVAVMGLKQIDSLPIRAGLSAAVLLLSNEGTNETP